MYIYCRAVIFLLLIHATAWAAAPAKLSRADQRWVEKTLRSMSLDEKIGQLLIPEARGNFQNQESEQFEKIRRHIVEFHVGGYHTFGGDPAGTALMVNEMQQLAARPLLITADLEGGAGYVLPGATRLPLAMAIGATGEDRYAYLAGKVAAVEGRAIGIHVNFYPVVDVQNNARNPIINIRSFGEDVGRVSAFARAYVRGAQENGQIATAKHFPGHGDVATDSHMAMPVLDISRERLDSVELPPFRAAVEEGVGAVMSAHIYLSQLEPERGLPATLSRNILTGLLREELGFEGIVFTDAMTMRGVSANFTNADATVRAIEAGADVILYPPSVEASFYALREAVNSGRLTTERIDASVRRLLEAKTRVGLHHSRTTDLTLLNKIVGSKQNREVAREIIESAITLVRDTNQAVPLKPSVDLRVIHFNLLDSRLGWREGPVGGTFAAELLKRFPRATTIQLDDQSAFAEYQMASKMADLADAIVVSGFIRVASYKGSIDMTPQQLALLRQLSTLKKPFVFALFGSPYLLTHVPELPNYILAYDTHPGAEAAAVKAITGEIPFRGRLPISLPGLYPVGHRLER